MSNGQQKMEGRNLITIFLSVASEAYSSIHYYPELPEGSIHGYRMAMGATKTREWIRRVSTKWTTPKCDYPPRPLLYLSSDTGLVVLLWNRTLVGPILNRFTIFNPPTKETVEIFTPFECHIYGVFYHPLLSELCLLWGHAQNGAVQFQLLNLGLNSCWRKLRPSRVISHAPQLRTQKDYPFVDVVGGASSVTVDGVLYWMVGYRLAAAKRSSYAPCAESIMAFGIKT